MARITLRLKNMQFRHLDDLRLTHVSGEDADAKEWTGLLDRRSGIRESEKIEAGHIEVRIPREQFPKNIDTEAVYCVECTVGFVRRILNGPVRRSYDRNTGRFQETPGPEFVSWISRALS